MNERKGNKESKQYQSSIYLQMSSIQADVHVLFSLTTILQMVECFDLVQGMKKTSGKYIDPQHAGRVHTQLEAV